MRINLTELSVWSGVAALKRKGLGRQTSGVILGVFGALLLSLAAFTSTAHATQSDCNPSPAVCMWYHANFTGPYFERHYTIVNLCYNMPEGFNDEVTSLTNWTNYTLQYFEHINCQMMMGHTLRWSSVANVGSGSNDKISSYRLTTLY